MKKEDVVIHWQAMGEHYNALTLGQEHEKMTELLNFIQNKSCDEIRTGYPLLFQREVIVEHCKEVDCRTLDLTSPHLHIAYTPPAPA